MEQNINENNKSKVEQFIASQLHNGHFQSKEEIQQRGIELLMRLHEIEVDFLVEHMRESAEAWKRGERGKTLNLEDFFQRADAQRNNRSRNGAQ